MTHRDQPAIRMIGRYRVVRRIGSGGMGEVLQGWDDQLQRPVALKGLPADVHDEGLRFRLRREALATAAINHPAIAHVYETVTHEGQDWLVMEYIDGQTIAEALGSGPFRFDEVARIGEEVARALHAAHEKGLIHRDVKAENVMITAEGHVKVLDFGLAKRRTSDLPADPRLTLEGTVLGTTRAMSPEQALGRELDARSDVFSLGSLLYEMATGRPAFRGETPAETLVMVTRGEFAPIDQARFRLPDDLIAIITRCLRVEPAERPASAGEVAAALRRVRATATHGTAVLPSAVLAAPARPRRWRIAATVALTTAVLAGTALVLGPRWKTARAVVIAPLPVQGAAIDPRTQVVVEDALRSALLRRSGVLPVPSDELSPCLAESGTATTLARQVAADELLECSLVRSGDTLRITLTRVAAASGRILWSGQAEVDAGSPLRLEAELASLVEAGFADHPPHTRSTPRELSADALVAYVDGRTTGGRQAARLSFERASGLAPLWVEPRLALFGDDRDAWLEMRASRRLDACREQLEQLRSLAPDDPRVIAAGIQLDVMEGRFGDALAAARSACDARPGDPDTVVRLALVLALNGDGAGARRAFATADELAPSWAVPFAEATARLALGDVVGANTALGEALQRSPGNRRVLGALVDVALRQDDLATAERWARQALSDREDTRSLLQLGLVVLLRDRPAEAADILRKATELSPGSPGAAIELASALWTSGETTAFRTASVAALLASGRALADDDGDPVARAARARALALLGRGPEAVLIANELQIERSGDPDATLAAALTAAVVGDRNTAQAALRLALEDGLQVAQLRRPELAALRSARGFEALATALPRPSPLRFVLPALD